MKYVRYSIFLALSLVGMHVSASASSTEIHELSSQEIDVIIANPDIQFVYIPQHIFNCIDALRTCVSESQCPVCLQDLFFCIEQKISIAPCALVVAALDEAINLYGVLKLHEATSYEATSIVAALGAYKESLMNGDAYIVCDEDDIKKGCCKTKRLCNLIVCNMATIKNLLVTCNTNLAGNLTVAGTTQLNKVTVNGDLGIQGTIEIIGSLDVPGDLTVGGNETVAGDLSVGGNETIAGNLTVNGTINTNSGFTFKDTLFSIVDATDATKVLKFDVQGNPGTTTKIITNPTTTRFLTTTNYDGTFLAVTNDAAGGQVFINSDVSLLSSLAGIQYSSTVANRGQIRVNQFGANAGVPGITTFKSRGTTIGSSGSSLAPVQVGDAIYRASAYGVSDNLSVPLSAEININVPAGGVPAGQGFIATEYELQLVSLDGGTVRPVYKITSEGVIELIESGSAGSQTKVPSDVVTLAGAGTKTVSNASLPTNARIVLTVQPTQAPTGNIYVSTITVPTSFIITSTAGAADNGVQVYYQVYAPLP